MEFLKKSWKIESKSWLEANCSQCFFKFGLCVTTRRKIALINKKYKRMKLWWNSRNRFLIGRFKSLWMLVYSSVLVIDQSGSVSPTHSNILHFNFIIMFKYCFQKHLKQRLFKKDLRDSLEFKSLVWYQIEIHLNQFLK